MVKLKTLIGMSEYAMCCWFWVCACTNIHTCFLCMCIKSRKHITI